MASDPSNEPSSGEPSTGEPSTGEPGGDHSPEVVALAPASPTVAIIGRPNVGKSSLFNRLLGRRQAIVHDLPGITRDRIFGSFELESGQPLQLIDTGGLVPGDDPLGLGDQVMLAMEESDHLVLVVDGKEGLVAADEKVWEAARRLGKPTLLAVNKADTRAAEENFDEFYSLGIGEQVLVSAEHGLGVGELIDRLRASLDLAETNTEDTRDETPSIAVVGRPNVGKSSLINRLLGEERVLVSPIAGTTRDPIDTLLTVDGRPYRLIDTAGIRRRSQLTGPAEGLAVLFARRQIDRAHIVILVIDGAAGVTSGDLAIAGEAWERGRAVVVAINKWDLLDEEAREHLEQGWPRLEELLAQPPRINLSALTGRRLDRLLPHIDQSLERYRLQLGTSQINRLFEHAVARHPAPQQKGRPWRLYYTTQVGTAPPTFMLFANRTMPKSSSYRRYLENFLRRELDLDGIPVRLVIRRRG